MRVFFYLEDRERTFTSATDKLLLSVTTFADELEREKARQRVSDAMLRKAKAGHVTGGRVFGYDNHEVLTADGRRERVERRINESEAGVVRRIFEMCAAGNGYSRIAKALNAEGAPSPRPQRQRPAGWAPSSVNEILHRPLYRGEIVWNQTRKRNTWGQHRQHARPKSDWVRVPAPDLRIVSDELWNTAQARLGGIRAHLIAASGGKLGRRSHDYDSRYLLPGFARCAVCGGGMCVTQRRHGRDGRAFYYSCLAYWKRGKHVCGNGLAVRMERVDRAVLRALAGDVLRPAIVMAVVDGVLEALASDTPVAKLEDGTRELAGVTQEIDRLTDAIAQGGALTPLLDALRARQARRAELLAAIAAERERQPLRLDRRAVEGVVRERLTDWQGLLTENVADGRELLRRTLAGPLRLTPEDGTYRFEGEAAIGRLLEGVIPLPTNLASPEGFEPSLPA